MDKFRISAVLDQMVGKRGTINGIVAYVGKQIGEPIRYSIDEKEKGDETDFSMTIFSQTDDTWYATIYYLNTRVKGSVYITEVSVE